MPRTPKQYYRYALTKLGLFNETAFRLVMDEIRPDDTFIVSYPKSGNTWIRFLLANLANPESEIHFSNIDKFVPDVYSASEEVNAMKSPRLIKVHHAEFESYPKSIYILRDYRDVLVSYFNYHRSLGSFEGNFPEFIRSVDTLHPFGKWKDHVQKAFSFSEKNPERILILRYEDLLQQTAKELERIATFIGYSGDKNFETIAEKCRFDELKRIEAKHGSAFREISGDYFFREGKSGKWKESFSAADLDFVLQENETVLRQAGYLNG